MQEESRLRSKDTRTQKEAAARASGTEPTLPKTSSGFIDTDDVHVVNTTGTSSRPRKRAYESITQSEIPAHSRDARSPAKKDGDGANDPLRPASKKFARFVDYNFSTMTDSKGGFLSAEDDPWNKSMSAGGPAAGKNPQEEQRPKHMTAAEWERLQLLRKLQRQKAGPYEPGLSAITDKQGRKNCRECGSMEIDFVWDEVFNCCVCNACKEKIPEKYSLLTKTECREDYLITDCTYSFSPRGTFSANTLWQPS